MRLETEDNNEFVIKKKDEEFRRMHIELKNWLWTRESDTEVSRKKVFPIYTDQLRLKTLHKELAKGKDEIGQILFDQHYAEKKKIQSKNYTDSICFKNYLEAFMTENTAMVDQVIELVEDYCMTRVSSYRTHYTSLRQRIESLSREKEKLEDQNNYGVLRPNASSGE